MENIYLIGMRGVGKSTVAKLLAERLKTSHIDLDEIIVAQEGKSIPAIVEAGGWEYFRKREREAVEKVCELENRVVSTGGGVLMFYDNAEKLKRSGIFVLLTADPETIYERLSEANDRPPLTNKSLREEIEQLWEERKEMYQEYANITIETDKQKEEEIVEEIMKSLNQ